jgi:hypothetical protein
VLALVFVVASLAKLADLAGSRRAIEEIGLPASLAAPLGTLLPLVELAVAAALLPLRTAPWAAIGGLALLLAFTAGIGLNVARGRRPECRCFGQIHSSPAGWPAIGRNALLAIIASFIVWQGHHHAGLSAAHWLLALSTTWRVALGVALLGMAVIAAETLALARLTAENSRLQRQIASLAAGAAQRSTPSEQAAPPIGLPVGSFAPSFTLSSSYGQDLTLDGLCAAARPVLLLFFNTRCGACRVLLPDVARWQHDNHEMLTIAVVGQHNREVHQLYGATSTPSAVVVTPDGRIGAPMAQGADAIRALVTRLLEHPRGAAVAAARTA